MKFSGKLSAVRFSGELSAVRFSGKLSAVRFSGELSAVRFLKYGCEKSRDLQDHLMVRGIVLVFGFPLVVVFNVLGDKMELVTI